MNAPKELRLAMLGMIVGVGSVVVMLAEMPYEVRDQSNSLSPACT